MSFMLSQEPPNLNAGFRVCCLQGPCEAPSADITGLVVAVFDILLVMVVRGIALLWQGRRLSP